MAEPILETDVFRFVTIRKPVRVKKATLSFSFIFFDNLQVNSTLFQQLSDVRDNDDAGSFDQLLAIAEGYKATNDFIASIESLEAFYPGFSTFSEKLNPNQISHSSLLGWIDETFTQKGYDSLLSGEGKRRVWESIFTAMIGGGSYELLGSLISALRVDNLIFHATQQNNPITGTGDLAELATAKLILPEPVYPLPDVRTIPKPEPIDAGTGVQTETANLMKQVEQYGYAVEELQNLLLLEIEQSRNKPVIAIPRLLAKKGKKQSKPQETVVQMGILSQKMIKSLSPETKEVLNELKIVAGVRISWAIERIERSASRLINKSFGAEKAVERQIQVGNSLWSQTKERDFGDLSYEVIDPRPDLEPDEWFLFYGGNPACKIRPIGIGDLRIVKQELICYKEGEVAHIENILKGEAKERTTRRLKRTEETLYQESESIEEKERDVVSTDRYELEKETAKMIQKNMDVTAGVNVSANYGAVQIDGSTSFGLATSTQTSDIQASRFAKEVTERALERVIDRVRSIRTVRTIEEFEETNLHSIDNTNGSDHIVGTYRWVDKYYEAWIENYGKRLMFEFQIPEPAAFHLHALTQEPAANQITLEKPIPPASDQIGTLYGLNPLISFEVVNTTDYGIWASLYGAKVKPPPKLEITRSATVAREGLDATVHFSIASKDIPVPEGYEAISAALRWGFDSGQSGNDLWISIQVGTKSTTSYNGGFLTLNLSNETETDVIPITVLGRTTMFGVNIEVTFKRSNELFSQWQIETYDAIMEAYNQKKAAYDNALNAYQVQAGVLIQGNNPDRNREIERTELKKGCIQLLTHGAFTPSKAMENEIAPCAYPEFDNCKAIKEGPYYQFIEQAFEWSNMTYLFYPYFYGRKCNWKKVYQLEDNDPLFTNFLQAGYARVIVPARPGFEEAALYFLRTGKPWFGDEKPGINTPLFLSIAQELKEEKGDLDGEVEPWEIRVPTSLAVLQCGSGCVGETDAGLPCFGVQGTGSGD